MMKMLVHNRYNNIYVYENINKTQQSAKFQMDVWDAMQVVDRYVTLSTDKIMLIILSQSDFSDLAVN